MALAVAHVGGNVTSGTGTVTSDTWTSTSGSDIVVVGHLFNNAGAATNGDITDAKSNTYTLLGSLESGASQPGIAVWHTNNTTRGASHTVTFNPTAGTSETVNIAVIEITGQDTSADQDATTFATRRDPTAGAGNVLSVTAAAAISGNQIAVFGATDDCGGNVAWTLPGGYTNIINQPNGATQLVSLACYKINETGTPTVTATRSDGTTGSSNMAIATFKEGAAAAAGNVVHPSVPFMSNLRI